MAADCEGGCVVLFGVEGDADGLTLPGGRRAVGVGAGICGITQRLFEDGLAAPKLGHDCVELLAIVGDAAVGGVVAVPGGGGIVGVEFREVEGGDAAGDAVDLEPASELPAPAERLGFLGGEAVVEAVGAADYEEVVGDFVGRAGGEFFEFGIDVEGADFEVLGESGGRLGGIGRDGVVDQELDGLPFSEGDDVGFADGMQREGGENEEEENRRLAHTGA